jgi:hypothetical protein
MPRILEHIIRFDRAGIACSCGRTEPLGDAATDRDRRKAAARHQLLIFLHEAAEDDEITTNCLVCEEKMSAVLRNADDRLAEYHDWIHRKCARCGMSPVDAVGATVS